MGRGAPPPRAPKNSCPGLIWHNSLDMPCTRAIAKPAGCGPCRLAFPCCCCRWPSNKDPAAPPATLCRLAAHLAAQRHYQAELKAELTTLKARLTSLLAEQERQQALHPGAFVRLASLKGLTMRRTSKSARSVRRMGSGNITCSASSTSLEERAAAAVLAAAADHSNHKPQQAAATPNGTLQEPVSASLPQLGSPATVAAPAVDAVRPGSNVQRAKGRTDQLAAPQQQQVVQQVSRLEQQLADLQAKEAVLRRELQSDRSATRLADRQGSMTVLGLGGGPDLSHRQQPVVTQPDAAAAGDAVLLDVGGADAGHHGQEQQPTCCWHDWRWVAEGMWPCPLC